MVNSRNVLFAALPNSVTLDNGDVFPLGKRDGIEKDARPAFPYVEIEPVDVTPVSKVLPARNEEDLVNQQKDTFTFDPDTVVYGVTEPDIVDVSSVTAASATFTEGTDFEIFTTEDSGLPNAIRWLSSGSVPLEDENFEVDYNHRLVNLARRRYEQGSFLVIVYAKQFKSGEGPATKDYSKSDLAIEVANAIEDDLVFRHGEVLGPNGELSLQAVRNFAEWGVHEGDSTVTAELEVVLKRTRDVLSTQQYRLVRKTNSNVTTSVTEVSGC